MFSGCHVESRMQVDFVRVIREEETGKYSFSFRCGYRIRDSVVSVNWQVGKPFVGCAFYPKVPIGFQQPASPMRALAVRVVDAVRL